MSNTGKASKLAAAALIALVAGLMASCASSSASQDSTGYENISSVSVGIYYENEKRLVSPSFINAVNYWLRRYSPRMITQSDEHIRMQARYGNLYDIELFIRDGTFEIVVTYIHEGRRDSDAQEKAVHLSTGLLVVMEDYIKKRTDSRN